MSLAKKSFSMFQRDALLFVTGTITSILIARKLGPDVMGIWMIIILIPIYAETFGRLKFDIAAIYFLGKGDFEERDVERTLNSIAIFLSILICIPCYIFSKEICQYLFNASSENVLLLRICLIQIPFTFLYMNYTYLFIYREDTVTYNRMVVIRALMGSIGAVLALYLFESGLFGVILLSISGIAFAFLYGFFRFKGRGNGNYPLINLRMIKTFSSYTSKLYLAGVISNLNLYVVRTLLAIFLAPSQLAFFGIAQDRAGLLTKIPESLNVLLFSRLSKSNSSMEKNELTIKGFRVILLAMSFGALLAIVFIYPMVWLLYGKIYLPMVGPFVILLPGIIASGCISVLLQYFNGTGKSSIQVLIFSIVLLVQAILLFVINKNLTTILASFVFSIAMILACTYTIKLFIRDTQFKWNDLVIKKSDVSIIANLISDKLKRKAII